MNQNITVTAYTRQLGEYYRELSGPEKINWKNSPVNRYLEDLLDKVQQLPSPEREERFVEGILGIQRSTMKRAA